MIIRIPVPSITTSWKTTVVGVLSLFVAAMQSFNDASIAAAILDPKVQMAVLIGFVGILAKDSNVTGGTKPATVEAEERVESAKISSLNVP